MTTDKSRILQEIIEMSGVIPPAQIGDDEFTVMEYAEEAGVSRSTAGEHLRKLLEAGKVSRRKTVVNGFSTYVYRKVVENGKDRSIPG